MPQENDRFMDTGEALVTVYSLAETCIKDNKYGMQKETLAYFQLALDTVHDFIVNNFDEKENE